MKTIKSVVPLTAAVAFFAAMNVQAYFDPSVGRWASRDPAGEDAGEFNLYGFVSNNSLNDFDNLGLMKWSDFLNIVSQLDQTLRSTKCCCINKDPGVVSDTITGTPSGDTVIGNATYYKQGCWYSYTTYWWDCYTAHEEAGFLNQAFFGADFRDYGYSLGGATYSKTASPGIWAWTGAGDPYHLAMDSFVIYTYCGGGFMHASYRPSNELEWTWNKKTKSWIGP